MAASTTSLRNSSSVREASSGENSMSSQRLRAYFTPSTAVWMIWSFAMPSLCSRWIALVARNTWMRGFSATLHGAPDLVDVLAVAAREARDDRALHFPGNLVHGLPVAPRGGRESGFDDVHAEFRQRACQSQLLGLRHAAAGRLLAVAQRRVEDQYAVRVSGGHVHYRGMKGKGGRYRPSLSQGMRARSCTPTFSIGCARSFFSSASYFLRPVLFSLIHCARERAVLHFA